MATKRLTHMLRLAFCWAFFLLERIRREWSIPSIVVFSAVCVGVAFCYEKTVCQPMPFLENIVISDGTINVEKHVFNNARIIVGVGGCVIAKSGGWSGCDRGHGDRYALERVSQFLAPNDPIPIEIYNHILCWGSTGIAYRELNFVGRILFWCSGCRLSTNPSSLLVMKVVNCGLHTDSRVFIGGSPGSIHLLDLGLECFNGVTNILINALGTSLKLPCRDFNLIGRFDQLLSLLCIASRNNLHRIQLPPSNE